MRVLVTGHHGYIGSLLMPLLAERGIDAVGLDSDLFETCTFGPPVVETWPSRHKDLRDVTVGDLEGFDAVHASRGAVERSARATSTRT